MGERDEMQSDHTPLASQSAHCELSDNFDRSRMLVMAPYCKMARWPWVLYSRGNSKHVDKHRWTTNGKQADACDHHHAFRL